MNPTSFEFEIRLWRQGKTHVAGIDEVGRGAFAGPLTVGAVIFPPRLDPESIKEVTDSKLLKPFHRLRLAKLIQEQALAWSVASSPVAEIDRLGIAKATFKAMRAAISRLQACDHILVDAFYIPYFKGLSGENQTPIRQGDKKSFSIAAASILAKVHRDRLMKYLAHRFPHYGWGRNKGYGTREHQQAILKHGPCRHHRRLYLRQLLA